MKKYVKEFLKRGLIFAGFGPIVIGIVYWILSVCINVTFSGYEIFMGIISTYLIAFIQAGASVFNQIESWSVTKSIAFHLASIYIAYLGFYLLNSWIPFEWTVVLIFTASFLLIYFVIWFTVYFISRKFTKELNNKIA